MNELVHVHVLHKCESYTLIVNKCMIRVLHNTILVQEHH